jgi:hypothetical protein
MFPYWMFWKTSEDVGSISGTDFLVGLGMALAAVALGLAIGLAVWFWL